MTIYENLDFDGHEKVLFCHDESIGLNAIIAIHSTALGPAAGGCRMFPYNTTEDALTDVLRLSKGMSYKNAISELPLGGGKSVIIADPKTANKKELLKAFSKHIQDLNGKYWTAIDIGVGPEDADVIAENCDYTFARASQYPAGFNPSKFTALGGFQGIKAVVKHIWKKDDLKGITVAVQGLGATGRNLSEHLFKAGAQLVVADINKEAVNFVVDNFGAKAVSPEEIHKQDVNVFAPCAMGGIINDESILEIKANAICGLANNQLATPDHGIKLWKRNITYVPDYLANAGGMMGAGIKIFSQPTMEDSKSRVLGLYDNILNLLDKAKQENKPTSQMADEIALGNISKSNIKIQ